MLHSEKINLVGRAIKNVQSECGAVKKSKTGYKFKYADLTQILECIELLCDKYDLSVLQEAAPGENGSIIVKTFILHNESGQWIEGGVPVMPAKWPLVYNEKEKDNGSHSSGSMLTYGRRYGLASMFMITQEDDDGFGGGRFENKNTYTAPPAPPPRAPQTPLSIDSVLFDKAAESLSVNYKQDDKLSAYNLMKGVSEKWSPDDKKKLFNAGSEEQRAWLKGVMAVPPRITVQDMSSIGI
jgi:hypothetical protein